jgi:Sulfotransferase family
MTLPTFFIIGAPRAGMTSLSLYLAQHAQIQIPSNPEPHFFAGAENGIPYPPGRVESLEDYERLFDPSFEVRGEASPSYAVYPRRKNVPARIQELVPEAKFIYLVRDPVERTLSHYLHASVVEGEGRSLREALGDLSDPYSPYVCASRYATQLEQYLSCFPIESFHVVDYADLQTDQDATLRGILSFLDVADTNDALAFVGEFELLTPDFPERIDRVVKSSLSPLPDRLLRMVRTHFGRLTSPLHSDPRLEIDLRLGLESIYVDEVERLRKITGGEFTTWSL